MCRVFVIILFFVSVNAIALGAKFEEPSDASVSVVKQFGLGQFEFTNNGNFSGVINIKSHVSGKSLKVFSGRYLNAQKGDKKSFVLITSIIGDKLNKESLYEFYTKTIENIVYEDKKIYVVFKRETEMYGWIEWRNNEFTFVLFRDPEL